MIEKTKTSKTLNTLTLFLKGSKVLMIIAAVAIIAATALYDNVEFYGETRKDVNAAWFEPIPDPAGPTITDSEIAEARQKLSSNNITPAEQGEVMQVIEAYREQTASTYSGTSQASYDFESDGGKVSLTQANVTIKSNKWYITILYLSSLLGWVAVLYFVSDRLLKFVQSAKNGQVFTTQNATRLQRVGQSMLAWTAISIILAQIIIMLVRNLDLAGPSITPQTWTTGWTWAMAGLLVLFISEIFKHGIELKKLEEATI